MFGFNKDAVSEFSRGKKGNELLGFITSAANATRGSARAASVLARSIAVFYCRPFLVI